MPEVVVPLAAPLDRIEPVRSVRSTLLSGSIQAMRARGLFESSLLETAYFRHAFRGVLQAGIELFCRKAFVTELPRRADVHAMKISWAGAAALNLL